MGNSRNLKSFVRKGPSRLLQATTELEEAKQTIQSMIEVEPEIEKKVKRRAETLAEIQREEQRQEEEARQRLEFKRKARA